MSASSKQLIELAQKLYDECLPSAELDRSLARLLREIPAVIGEQGWLSAHQYAVDLEVRQHRESLVTLCGEAATLFGAALLNLSVHTHNASSLEQLSRRLLSLRALLSGEVNELRNIEAELGLRLSDPDLALIEMNKRRLQLLKAPKHSSAELIEAARSLERLRVEAHSAEQTRLKQEEETSALRARLNQEKKLATELKQEEATLKSQLNDKLDEEKRLSAHIESLTSELKVVSARLTSLKQALSKLEEDPRSQMRAAIASALAALPEDHVERS